MKRAFLSLITLVAVGLPACLPQATRTAVPTGISEGGSASDVAAGTEIAKGDGPNAPSPADETANQPGPGGSMPTGTLAPIPWVPGPLPFRAEAMYCRFEGDDSGAMISGTLFNGARECTEGCGKELMISYRYQGVETFQIAQSDEGPDFQFVVNIDDPKQFSLSLIMLPRVADIGQQTPAPPPDGLAVLVSSLQPYTVDGTPAFCPKRSLMKARIEPLHPVDLPPEPAVDTLVPVKPPAETLDTLKVVPSR